MASEYYVLEKSICPDCEGSGIVKALRSICDGNGVDTYYADEDCEPCNETGYTFQPIEVTGDVLRNLLSIE